MEDMSTRSGNKLTEEQIEQLIKRLRGVEHIEPIVTIEDSNVNNEKMATFAEVVNNQSNNKNNTDESDSKHEEQNKDYASGDSVKPLFLVDQDVFGSTKPDRTHWLTNVEIYKAVGSKVPAECIKGIQRIRDMWRIYMDNTEDRITLIVEGLNLRGRRVPLHTQNPRNPQRFRPDTIRIKVKNIPLSADDGQIHRTLTLEGCNIEGIFREKLRVDGRLTNCDTGDRLVISKPLPHPLPRSLQIGKYWGRIFHPGQVETDNQNRENNKNCHKCLKPGHFMYQCKSDWVCRSCNQKGHKMEDCPHDLVFSDPDISVHDGVEEENLTEHDEDDDASQAENSQPHNKAVQSITTDKEDKDIEAKGNKKVKIIETDKSENKQVKAGQKTMDNFMKTSNRPSAIQRTPPTPTEKLHDQQGSSKGRKKLKPSNRKT